MKAPALALALLTAQSGSSPPSPPAVPSPVVVPPAAAAIPTGEDRLRRVRERREALARELARLRGEEKSLLGDVERLEVEVRLLV